MSDKVIFFLIVHVAMLLFIFLYICIEIRSRKHIKEKYANQKMYLVYYLKLSSYYIAGAFFLIIIILFLLVCVLLCLRYQ